MPSQIAILRRRVRNLRRCLERLDSEIYAEARMRESCGMEPDRALLDLDRRILRALDSDDANAARTGTN
ncbi:MAG: hypothetical protein ACYDC1_25935 [Limisphaerales bacterium]